MPPVEHFSRIEFKICVEERSGIYFGVCSCAHRAVCGLELRKRLMHVGVLTFLLGFPKTTQEQNQNEPRAHCDLVIIVTRGVLFGQSSLVSV